ncbi:MAG: V-type ATP synthase subunit D [Lentisphaerae bacterium]|nr:V-type ATP synthase subunit D [Lentisphaerota bacterium]
MSKLKLTKTELKTQTDALKQYRRFLPTLQLKKQQLQLELRKSRALVEDNRRDYAELRSKLEAFVGLYADENAGSFIRENLAVTSVIKSSANIAGVTVPVFDHVEFAEKNYDLFAADFWLDSGLRTVKELIALKEAGKVLEEQYRLLNIELLSTTQRVNLFEKVKIPECMENIRKIQISLGDATTAAVVRSKIAKRKMQEAAA